MLRAHNDYFPYVIAPSTTLDIVVETVATRLPILEARVIVRNIESVLTLPVTWSYELEVADAPMNFVGTWVNTLLEGDVGPEGLLVLTPVQTMMDGVYGRHRLTIENPSALANVLVHVLLNGSVESVSALPIQTLVSV